MTCRTVLYVLIGAAILVNGISVGMVIAGLERRGYKTKKLFLRLYFLKYLRAYRELTEKETGKPGLFYGLWIGSVALMLVLAVSILLAAP